MASAFVEAEGMECTDPDEVCGQLERCSSPSYTFISLKPKHFKLLCNLCASFVLQSTPMSLRNNMLSFLT